jgi:VanZ family protein
MAVTPLRALRGVGDRRPARALLWLWPLLVMAAIFFLSAQPNLNSGLGAIDTIGRKLAHLAEYALLAILWWRALRTRTSSRRAALGALLIASLYAASDEYHQSFVEGRSGDALDWAIDSFGAAVGLLLRERRQVHA